MGTDVLQMDRVKAGQSRLKLYQSKRCTRATGESPWDSGEYSIQMKVICTSGVLPASWIDGLEVRSMPDRICL